MRSAHSTLQLVTYDISGGEEPSTARLAVNCTPLASERLQGIYPALDRSVVLLGQHQLGKPHGQQAFALGMSIDIGTYLNLHLAFF